jgi:hypothetical protein
MSCPFTVSDDSAIIRSPGPVHDEVLARRLGVTPEEIAQRRADLVAAIAASSEGLDALAMVFTELCAAYQEMGEKLKVFSELISRQETLEGLDEHVTTLLKSGEPVAPKLMERYVLLPRPTVQLAQPSVPARPSP